MKTMTAEAFMAMMCRAGQDSEHMHLFEFKNVEVTGDIDFNNIFVSKLFLSNVIFTGNVTGIITVGELTIHNPMGIYYSSIEDRYAGSLIKELTK